MPTLSHPVNYPLEFMISFVLDYVIAFWFHYEGALFVPEDVHIAKLSVFDLLDEGQSVRDVLVWITHLNLETLLQDIYINANQSG